MIKFRSLILITSAAIATVAGWCYCSNVNWNRDCKRPMNTCDTAFHECNHLVRSNTIQHSNKLIYIFAFVAFHLAAQLVISMGMLRMSALLVSLSSFRRRQWAHNELFSFINLNSVDPFLFSIRHMAFPLMRTVDGCVCLLCQLNIHQDLATKNRHAWIEPSFNATTQRHSTTTWKT